jgi:CHAD domain-containing protein
VRALLENARAHVRRDAQALLLKPAFTQLILDIERDLLRPPATPEQEKARPWAAKILQKRWEALNKRCQKFATLCPNERHLARIAAKKMRYAADALTPLYGKNSRPFIKALAALQNSLGSANDAQVGAQLLHALPKESALQAFELGRLAGTLESETKQRAHLSNTVWHRLARTKLFWCP